MEKLAQVAVRMARWDWPTNWPSLFGLCFHPMSHTHTFGRRLLLSCFPRSVLAVCMPLLVAPAHVLTIPLCVCRLLRVGDLRSLAQAGEAQRYMALVVWRGIADDVAAPDIPPPARTRILKGLQGEQVRVRCVCGCLCVCV
jgi:hypothetical protein